MSRQHHDDPTCRGGGGVLPSIEQFRSDVERCSRRIVQTVSVAVGSMLVFLLLSLGASKLSEESLGPVLSKFLPAAFFLIGLPLMLFGFWRADQLYKKFAMLTCQHCGKSLVQSSRIVIASRNCPHCGRQVVAAPESTA
jgi:predicted RNA-binding Zn-ribbon protein involved in translation (DUF1610 family)